MFVTLDCGKTVATYKTQFSPRHLEFDEKLEGIIWHINEHLFDGVVRLREVSCPRQRR